MNADISPQLSGPIVQAIMDGISQSFHAVDMLLEYWRTLSADTAIVDADLDFIGQLAGYPRPLVPQDFFNLNVFHLSDSADWPQTSAFTGLGDSSDPGVGGLLGSVFPPATSIMPQVWYRQLIPLAAMAKFYGLTIETIDRLANWASDTYTIDYRVGYKGDIDVNFATDIGYPKKWILDAIFQKYETSTVVRAVIP